MAKPVTSGEIRTGDRLLVTNSHHSYDVQVLGTRVALDKNGTFTGSSQRQYMLADYGWVDEDFVKACTKVTS